MNISEVEGGWIITATERVGRPQRYFCPTLACAQRWSGILGAPRRETAPPLRVRQQQAAEEEDLEYTITWVGPPEIAVGR